MTPTTIRLSVRPGEGRLVRGPVGVLFAPVVGDETASLVRTVAAASHDLVDQVTAAVVEADFAVAPFALVAWENGLVALVFGDVELRTDHPALRMLSGAASETWVEHTLRSPAEQVTFAIAPPDEGDDTDLAAGTVPAGGFELRVTVGAPAASAPEPEPAPEPASAPEPEPEPATSGDATEAIPAGDPYLFADDESLDPDASLAAIRAAAVVDGPDASDDALPSPPPAPEPAAGDTTALVDAVDCPAGHTNPPGAATCRRCGRQVPEDAAVRPAPQPVLGMLEVVGAEPVPLDRDVVLGRRPTTDDEARVMVVAGEKVSRTHARVTVRGWDMTVHDLGSTNGTHVVARPGDEPVTLDGDVPAHVFPGAVIYVGASAVRVVPPS